MTGVEILGEIETAEHTFGFSKVGLIFAIIGVASAILYIVAMINDDSTLAPAGVLCIISMLFSLFCFFNAVEIPCTHYLIRMSDDAGYNEFNSSYNILNEICNGYYIVEKIEQDVAQDE